MGDKRNHEEEEEEGKEESAGKGHFTLSGYGYYLGEEELLCTQQRLK